MNSTPIDSEPSGSAHPSLLDLFLAFLGIALIGFGGVMPWARRMLVEKRKWLTPTEFAEALALAQFLPGGNIVNLSVAVGQRYHGLAGSLAAVTGLIGGPFVLVTAAGSLYLRYGETPVVHHVLSGVTAGAAGLMLCMGAQMARPLLSRGALIPLAFAAIAFVTVGLAKLPLIPVLAVLIPVSVAVAWSRLP